MFFGSLKKLFYSSDYFTFLALSSFFRLLPVKFLVVFRTCFGFLSMDSLFFLKMSVVSVTFSIVSA